MIVDQDELSRMIEGDPPEVDAPPAAPPLDLSTLPPEVRRLLKLRVPVIVQLARRRLPICQMRRLSLGRILEFQKPVAQPLQLLVNNEVIAEGEAIKIGENFGLRLRVINDRASRIRALGENQS